MRQGDKATYVGETAYLRGAEGVVLAVNSPAHVVWLPDDELRRSMGSSGWYLVTADELEPAERGYAVDWKRQEGRLDA